VLNVKDVDAYLPTIEEAAKMAQARSQQPPSMDDQEKQSKMDLNKASAGEKEANTAFLVKKTEDIDMDNYFEGLAADRGKLTAVQVD
jgi:hypothetical protein